MVQHLHQNQRKQEKDPMMASDIAVYPFQIVGTDLFHWNGQNFLLVVDYRSKYWKIERLNSTTSGSVIQKLKMFSRLSIPEVVRNDNETHLSICQEDLQDLLNHGGFQHVPTVQST